VIGCAFAVLRKNGNTSVLLRDVSEAILRNVALQKKYAAFFGLCKNACVVLHVDGKRPLVLLLSELRAVAGSKSHPAIMHLSYCLKCVFE